MSDAIELPDQGGQSERVAGDFVIIPRAQHEALMAAAKALAQLPEWERNFVYIAEALAALRDAGILDGKCPK